MRELVLGPMPFSASPDSHLPAGPWCFCGREKAFPGWDDPACGFALPPDPFACAEEMHFYTRKANAEAIRLIPILAAAVNRLRGAEYPDIFWETALGPWLILCVQMLAERQKRMLDLLEIHGGRALRVSLLPRGCSFFFRTSLEFMTSGVLDPVFNHYILSRLVEAAAPRDWDLRFLPAADLSPAGGGSGGLVQALAEVLRRAARQLPFPFQKGFSPIQCLCLSLAVLGNRSPEDRTLGLAAYASTPLEWIFPAEEFIAACLPRALLELPLPALPSARGRLRGMTAAAGQDDGYRLAMAAWRAGGGRLFSVQHGANYGNLRSMGGSFFEYRQHAFITWGWRRHRDYPCNSLPLPHPLPARLSGRHRERRPELILVGTEMSLLLYRLKSRPQAGKLPGYRRDKIRFFRALPEHLLAASLYRPYAASSNPAALEDGPHILRAIPGLALCSGDLTRKMLNCRLLVLDHYGTTLHLALAADVPTICFWDREQWGMEEATEQALDVLAGAGILLPGPEEAAAAAAAAWPDAAVWWKSPTVQEARRYWLERYALPADRGLSLRRLWSAALRSV
ncbi:MAG: hypothetical protein LBO77_03280 [Desulfovibrio sp.]|jgi:hypothetical protein|nr:hypothetical protein [Desulfovibrio sp.]